MTQSLEFAGLPLLLAILIAVTVGVPLAVGYVRSLRGRARHQRYLLLGLRLAALIAIVWLCLLPFWQRRRLDPVPPRVAMLVDLSPSMRLSTGGKTGVLRRDAARRIVEDSARQPVQIELFSFSTDLVRGLGAEGGVTQMYEALSTLADQSRSSGLKAIVLVSDGRATDQSSAALPVPVYAVPLGPLTSRDLGIEADPLTAEVQPDQPVTVTGKVYRSDSSIEAATVELWAGSTQVGTKEVHFASGSEEAGVEFQHTPEDAGLVAYRLQVRPEAGAPPAENDVAYLATVATPSKQRILILSSHPDFESAFLGRQLDGESDLQVTRADRIGDRLVLGDGSTGGPELLQPLRRYAAVIVSGSSGISDLGPGLADYLKAGGGLLLFPGPDDVAVLTQANLTTLLPVSAQNLELREGSFVVNVTPDRGLHPLLSFLDELPEKRAEPAALPPLAWAYAGGVPRFGSRTLLVADIDGVDEPLLCVQRYGQGRVGMFGGGPLWSWRFQPVGLGSGKEELYIRLIPRLARWAASGGEFEQFRLTARGHGVGEPLEVRLVQLLEDLTPAEGQTAFVEISRVESDGQETRILETELKIGAGGSAQWSPILAEPGVYRIRAGFDQRSVTREAAVALNYPPGELAFSSVALTGLQRVTSASGGRIVPVEELPSLYAELASRDRSFRMLFEREPTWSSPWLLALCVGLLLLEWLLRRTWSLP